MKLSHQGLKAIGSAFFTGYFQATKSRVEQELRQEWGNEALQVGVLTERASPTDNLRALARAQTLKDARGEGAEQILKATQQVANLLAVPRKYAELPIKVGILTARLLSGRPSFVQFPDYETKTLVR